MKTGGGDFIAGARQQRGFTGHSSSTESRLWWKGWRRDGEGHARTHAHAYVRYAYALAHTLDDLAYTMHCTQTCAQEYFICICTSIFVYMLQKFMQSPFMSCAPRLNTRMRT